MKSFVKFDRTTGEPIYVNPDYVVCLTPSPSEPTFTRIHLSPTTGQDEYVTVPQECEEVADALEQSSKETDG